MTKSGLKISGIWTNLACESALAVEEGPYDRSLSDQHNRKQIGKAAIDDDRVLQCDRADDPAIGNLRWNRYSAYLGRRSKHTRDLERGDVRFELYYRLDCA